MILHSPAELYFKYLVVHPACYDNSYIHTTAQGLDLDYLGDSYVQSLRERMRPPTPFYPEDTTHEKSQRFLLRERLEKAFLPNSHWRAALRLLSKPVPRELVESLLLARAPVDAILHALNNRCALSVTEETIRLFKAYFWDVDLLSHADMRAYVDMKSTGAFALDTDADKLKQLSSLKRVKHSDPRALAARLPHMPITAALVQLELGVLPKRMDLSGVLEATAYVASVRAFEALCNGGPVGANMAAQFSQVALQMHQLQKEVVNPEDKLREDLVRISLATSSRKVPTLAALTKGRHTTNVHPEPAPEAGRDDVLEADFEEVEEDDDEQPNPIV